MSGAASPQPEQPVGRPRRRSIREDEWFLRLEQAEPLHQWGSTFLVDLAGAVEAWVRDVTGAGRHTVLRWEGRDVERVRAGVAQIEAAAARAADLVTEQGQVASQSLAERRLQEEASQRFVELAESFYRALLDGPGAAGPGGD